MMHRFRKVLRATSLQWLPIILLATQSSAQSPQNPQTDSQTQPSAVVTIDFTNPQLTPAHWQIKLSQDGSAQFDSGDGQPSPMPPAPAVLPGTGSGAVHRTLQLSPEFTAQVFTVARQHKLFAYPCESHMKVAFQGTKRLTYTGPEGAGSCEYNYSKDKEIQNLGDSLLGVENTVMFGARLEKLLQHDRLGLDQEMENLVVAAREGNAVEMGAIRDTLTRIAGDDQVLERARRKARLLLTQAH